MTEDVLHQVKQALADRYSIQRELGRGGMAIVYLAEDLKLHRQVAIKVLRPELTASLGTDRFVQEIELTAKLQHPQILPLYEAGEADGFLFYVMPYVEGETLRDSLDREKTLPLAPWPHMGGVFSNLLLATLWQRQGEYHKALEAVRRRAVTYDSGGVFFFLPYYLELEGRLAAMLGDTAGAIAAYDHYLKLRTNPDPGVLMEESDAVRQALAELVGEGGR